MWSLLGRICSAVLFCTAVFFSGSAASWASGVGPEPEPMPLSGGVASEWRCSDQPLPAPTETVTPTPYATPDPDPTETVTPAPYTLPTPTATAQRCVVLGWSALPPSPTPTSTVTVTETAAPVALTGEVTLAPDTFALGEVGGPVLFLLGLLAMLALASFVYKVSAPPTFGIQAALSKRWSR